VVSGISTPEIQEISVSKTNEVLNKLEMYNSLHEGGKTLSPSALNKFLACPLQFYFRYLAGLKEPEEITEDVDLPLFGSLLHKALELLYKEYLDKEITADELNKIEKDNTQIENVILNAFREEYFTDIPVDQPVKLSGKNILIKEILQKYIKQFLRVDQKFAPFTVRSLENEYSADIRFDVNGTDKQVTFKGVIDRLDENKNGIRVIDYKTGKPEQSFKDMSQLFDERGNHKALQALLYSRMYDETEQVDKEIIPGLYFIRNLFNNGFDYTLKSGRQKVIYQQVANSLDEHLKKALQDLFDPEQDFYQTEDHNICRNCPYKQICRR
jgi:ATP-dependent helicase/DNAse subunit B